MPGRVASGHGRDALNAACDPEAITVSVARRNVDRLPGEVDEDAQALLAAVPPMAPTTAR
jgi:hypothetical protein